jgi:hypothetical protein
MPEDRKLAMAEKMNLRHNNASGESSQSSALRVLGPAHFLEPGKNKPFWRFQWYLG